MKSVPKDFFVSYTTADKAWAEWIANVLETAGYTVVIQAWDFRPGSNFVVEMQRGLQACRRVVAVLSPAYLAKPFPMTEWATAFADDPEGAKRAMVPIMVEECTPRCLLSQVVQIRIQGLDEDDARRQILEGVRPERSKPTTPPPFPGRATGLSVPTTVVRPSFPARTSDSADNAARLRWQSPAPAVDIAWRADVDDVLPNQVGYEAVELHLAFPGDDARLQVRDLQRLKVMLPDHGRRHGLFSPLEALKQHADGVQARVTSADRTAGAGIAVTRRGQRSAWQPLPRDTMGAILDEEHLADQLRRMIETLAALDLPAADLVVPAVALEPATMISYARVGGPPRTSAGYGSRMPQRVRPAYDEAIGFTALTIHYDEVGAELAARIVAEHRTANGPR